MLNDDIIIGDGEKQCSATLCFGLNKGIGHEISENSSAYWISYSEATLGLGLTIYKNTPEGKKLNKLISKNASLKKVNKLLMRIILTKITTERFLKILEGIKEEAFIKGKKSKVEEFKDLLEIED